jgi:hypothetical protein
MLQLSLALLFVSAAYAAYAEHVIGFEQFVIGLACAAYVVFMRLLFSS